MTSNLKLYPKTLPSHCKYYYRFSNNPYFSSVAGYEIKREDELTFSDLHSSTFSVFSATSKHDCLEKIASSFDLTIDQLLENFKAGASAPLITLSPAALGDGRTNSND